MDIANDNRLFFRDFGVDITLWPETARAVTLAKGCIPDQEFLAEAAGGRITTFTTDPKCTCVSSDVAGLAQGDQVFINPTPALCVEGGLFEVVGTEPDGTGMTILELHAI